MNLHFSHFFTPTFLLTYEIDKKSSRVCQKIVIDTFNMRAIEECETFNHCIELQINLLLRNIRTFLAYKKNTI